VYYKVSSVVILKEKVSFQAGVNPASVCGYVLKDYSPIFS